MRAAIARLPTVEAALKQARYQLDALMNSQGMSERISGGTNADWIGPRVFSVLDTLDRAEQLLEDDGGRVRRNPGIVLYGNPGGRDVCLSRGGVQCVVYTHAKDGSNRAHGFGNAAIDLQSRGTRLTVTGLREETGVSLYGTPDKRAVHIVGDDGQAVWEWFPDEEDDG